MRDRFGRFLDAYGEYLRGERSFDDVPLLGGRRYSCSRCDHEWVDYSVTFGSISNVTYVKLCADCETWAREPRQPLPVARLLVRR